MGTQDLQKHLDSGIHIPSIFLALISQKHRALSSIKGPGVHKIPHLHQQIRQKPTQHRTENLLPEFPHQPLPFPTLRPLTTLKIPSVALKTTEHSCIIRVGRAGVNPTVITIQIKLHDVYKSLQLRKQPPLRRQLNSPTQFLLNIFSGPQKHHF